MALCDELEAKQAKKRDVGDRLTKAALAALTSAETPEEFKVAWVRVSKNFRVLLDSESALRDFRQTVLSLAVRGNLTNRASSDSTVEDVLCDVEKKRAAVSTGRRASRAESYAPVGADAPHRIPDTWRWVRLGEVTICRDGERIPLSKAERAPRRGEHDYYGASGVIDSIDDFIFDEPLLLVGEDGANLLNRSTPIAFMARGKYWVNNHAHVLDSAGEDVLEYLAIYINATDLEPYVTGTAQPKMNQAKMNQIPVALPPRAEQGRIVTMVNQLTALCDELETELRARSVAAENLATALAASAASGLGMAPYAEK